MPDIKRHKTFLKDYASIRLTDGQFEKLVIYIATLKEGDDLYCKQPLCELILSQGFDFILVCKPDFHKTLRYSLSLY